MSERDLRLSTPASYELVREFLALFAHEIRSPLSVLSNDITYLSAKYVAEELTSSKDSINRTVELLAPFDSLAKTATSPSTCSVTDFIQEFTKYFQVNANESQQAATLRIDLKSIQPCLTALLTEIDSQKIIAEFSTQGLVLSITCSKKEVFQKSGFNSLRFPLKPSAAPTKLALAELFLILSGVQISTESDRLTICLPYDSPEDSRSR